MGLVSALVVEKELQDARERRGNAAAGYDKSKGPCCVRPEVCYV